MAYSAAIIRRVRLLIPDTEAVYGDAGDEYIFPDEDIELYLDEGYENVKCAAGLAKLSIGGSEALIGKVIRNYETETDASKLLKEWTAAGEKLYDRGLAEIADVAADEGIFEIVFPEFGYERHPEGYTHGSYQIGGWLDDE
jgi:hypothetical protein